MTRCILLVDPDEAGEQLANMVHTVFPHLKQVFLNREECLCYRNQKLKVGVEHCSNEYLKSVLQEYGMN